MSRIVTCVSGPGLIKSREQIDGKPCGELRLDLVNLSTEEIKILWKSADEWILTLRQAFTDKENWKSVFKSCLELKPVYVDIDSELSEEIKKEVSQWVKSTDSELMYSYHNFEKTPDFDELSSTIKQLYNEGAHVVKIAVMANEEEDNLIVMDLYREHSRLVAFCMGAAGKESRVTSLFFGEKMTYAAPSQNEEVASGQFTYDELYQLLNFGFDE